MSADRQGSSPAIETARAASSPKANGADSNSSIDIAIDVDPPEEKAPATKVETSPPTSTSTGRGSSPNESVSPPSSRLGESTARIGETTRKTRAKVTLKIPDDEVARPTSPPSSSAIGSRSAPLEPRPVPVTQVDSRPPVHEPEPRPYRPDPSAVIVTPMRIISIEPPPMPASPSNAPFAATMKSVAPPRASAPSPAPGTVSTKEDSWTPYQPTASDRPAPVPAAAIAPPPVAPRPPRASHHEIDGGSAARAKEGESAKPPSVAAPAAPPPVATSAPVPPSPPSATQQMPAAPATERRLPPMESVVQLPKSHDSSDDIPIVTDGMDANDDAIEPEPTTSPRVPVASTPPPPAPPQGHAAPVAMPLTPIAPVVHTALTPSVPPAKERESIATSSASSASSPIAPSPSRLAALATPQPAIDIRNLPPMRAMAPTEPEGLEVHFEDDAPAPSPRSSEPEAEIAAEDLVSVESAPIPAPSIKTDTSPRAFTPVGVSRDAVQARGSMPPPPKSQSGPASTSQSKNAPRVIVPTAAASPIAPPAMTSDHQTARRKVRPWWEELFNDDFIRTMAKISDDQISGEVDFIEESLAVAKGAMLLDLACGTGRHAIELTRRGYKVVGFDLSLPMLARAAEEAQERQQKLNFVQGDMREMTFEDTFDGIYCWATSFGFFEEEKNALVVQKMHKALKKGGQLLLDVVNRDYMARNAPSLAWFEGDACVCMDEMSIDWITSRMKVKRTMMMDDGRTKEIDYSIRIYSLHELGKILHEAGFRVAEVSGRCATPGVFFGAESPRTMILAEKK